MELPAFAASSLFPELDPLQEAPGDGKTDDIGEVACLEREISIKTDLLSYQIVFRIDLLQC